MLSTPQGTQVPRHLDRGVAANRFAGLRRIFLSHARADDWVTGNTDGSGSLSKEADHLRARVAGNLSGTANRFWDTSEKVDLSQYKAIDIDWEAVDEDEEFNSKRLFVNPDPGQHDGPSGGRLAKAGTFSRRIDTYDIGSKEGLQHVSVGTRDLSGLADRPGTLKVYNVTLRK